jgi:hypothetical protein
MAINEGVHGQARGVKAGEEGDLMSPRVRLNHGTIAVEITRLPPTTSSPQMATATH